MSRLKKCESCNKHKDGQLYEVAGQLILLCGECADTTEGLRRRLSRTERGKTVAHQFEVECGELSRTVIASDAMSAAQMAVASYAGELADLLRVRKRPSGKWMYLDPNVVKVGPGEEEE